LFEKRASCRAIIYEETATDLRLGLQQTGKCADRNLVVTLARPADVNGTGSEPNGSPTGARETSRADEALRQSEARLQALLDLLDDLVFELDENGTYLGIWTTDDALLAAPRHELLGRTVRQGLGDKSGRELMELISRVLETSRPEIFEYCLDVPAGIRWFQARLAPIAGSSGSSDRVCLLVRDVTAQKAAAQEMGRSLERLELIHEADRYILDCDSVTHLSQMVLRRLRGMVGAERGSVVIFDLAAEEARFLVIDPEGAPGPPQRRISLDEFMPRALAPQRGARSYADIREIKDPPLLVQELLAAGIRSMTSAAIVDEGTTIGEINLASTRAGGVDPHIDAAITEMADQLAVAMRQARLKDASEARANELEAALSAVQRADTERVELLSRLVNAQEEERQRIASDLHDDSIQKVAAASMRLEMLAMAHPELAEDEGFVKAKATVLASIESMRHLMFELRPYILDRDGLGPALLQLLDEDFGYEGGPFYELSDGLSDQPPEVARVVLFRITQEALVNVRKHARASKLRVELWREDSGYFVRVTDDGVGFNAERRTDSPRGHLGLTSMRQRAQLARGGCTIDSSPGTGTVVSAWVPGPWHAVVPVA
jgi:PAS domain S-box-containing protein